MSSPAPIVDPITSLVPPTRIDFDPADRAWIAERIMEALESGRLTLGPWGEKFEAAFAAFSGAKHAIAVNSGTCSLEIMLRAIDGGKGVHGADVLVPANTFVATATATLAAGANVVLMDTDLRTMSTTPEEIARRLTPKTKAVFIVHIGGIITDRMPEIVELCRAKGVVLLEDAAHAHGVTLSGVHAGLFGQSGSFSFYPTKVMTSGEGGMIVTNDEAVAAEARILRDQGKEGFLTNRHIRIGSNWRLSEPHAIIGLRHLEKLPSLLAGRRRIGARFDAALKGRNSGLQPLEIPEGCVTNYYKYITLLAPGLDRGKLKAWLRETHGVACSGEVYENAVQMNPAFAFLDTGDLAGSVEACGRQLCLPVFGSMTDAQADRTIEALLAAQAAGLV
jgi:perosamine synthetase